MEKNYNVFISGDIFINLCDDQKLKFSEKLKKIWKYWVLFYNKKFRKKKWDKKIWANSNWKR